MHLCSYCSFSPTEIILHRDWFGWYVCDTNKGWKHDSFSSTLYMTRVTGATCGVAPRRQADGFFKVAELRVVQPKGLVDNVRRWLHVHLQDGHQLAVDFKCNLLIKGWAGGRVSVGGRLERWEQNPEQMESAPGCYRLIVTRWFCLIFLPWLTLF